MKSINQLAKLILLALNLLFGTLLLLCAYWSYTPPTILPFLSGAALFFPIFLLLTTLFLFFWLVIDRKYALCSTLFLIGCIGPIGSYIPIHFPSTPPEGSIKLLSYNTMLFQDENKKNKGCPKEMLTYLQESHADIICMQEFPVKNARKTKEIDNALKEYPYKKFSSITQSYGLACYSRYPILSANKVDYKSKANGSIAYHIKIGNDTILLINNHLESNKLTQDDKKTYREILKNPSQNNVSKGSKKLFGKLAEASIIRAPQAQKIVEMVGLNKTAGAIVCGDFNDPPLSYTQRTIGKKLTDTYADSGCGIGVSYNQNRFYFRIDHIFVSDNFKAYNCTVDRSIKSSDHYPIWCYLKMKDGKSKN
ncbi:MAG: endonuclease/exonuclease/phosphatase family protein, partial [Phocaeicola sp.]